ncbi:helix-turn-helix transcriptional regulator (plasmid) [Aneurinibacillus sp. Ricciae_BoGa-3]|uniref:helix-turn-helix domain-containing protein n=1 Tax=Aneurinibacillus sp. Ricciae_BoGa-3 TaxID=3022697 RepID=UPI00233FC8B3|nr:helix-turn-helix transcriptional regulator [Aneurinibacillus sp. Ricciae_BoGa-3]WCK57227.1 helix-turn-helix transcriptional regulator [Aneurinibacillus sp. Ricciae_BoGa-3]
MNTIGEKIKNLRIEKGYSLRKLGEKINVDHSHLSRIENGLKTPNLELLDTLSKVFDVDIADFFQEKEDVLNKPKNDWLSFGEEMEKRKLTPGEIIKMVDVVLSLSNT